MNNGLGLNVTQQIVVLILGGGMAGTIFTLVKSYIAVRNNVDSREATGIENLERWRRQADERAQAAENRLANVLDDLDFFRTLIDYWWRRAMTLEQCIINNGGAAPPCPPPPVRPSTRHEEEDEDEEEEETSEPTQ